MRHMTEDDKYFFDLWGYLVVENALTPEEVGACNAALDHHGEQIRPRSLDDPLARGSKTLTGTGGRLELTGMLGWERPWCEPFRNLLVHPNIVNYMYEMMGPGYRLDHGPLLIAAKEGTEGHQLHGAGEPLNACVNYFHQNGRMFCGGVTVAWQFTDVNPGDGGFCCVPGSHKSNYRAPKGVLTVENDRGCVKQVAMKAGDVLLFCEGTSHGTLPWKGAGERRSVLYKFAAGFMARAGGPHTSPESRWGEFTKDMTEEQRAVMLGPYIHGPQRHGIGAK
ncbi:MAG: hypothetical protein EXS64_10935 [Candidatus Latescibacteria bacterium]|nr:hypothetical protein [Candidatus Latescibacterota bacterium]